MRSLQHLTRGTLCTCVGYVDLMERVCFAQATDHLKQLIVQVDQQLVGLWECNTPACRTQFPWRGRDSDGDRWRMSLEVLSLKITHGWWEVDGRCAVHTRALLHFVSSSHSKAALFRDGTAFLTRGRVYKRRPKHCMSEYDPVIRCGWLGIHIVHPKYQKIKT